MGVLEYVKKCQAFIQRLPGEKYFGQYRFLPFFFFGGAVVEFLMIKWRPFGINFYDSYKTKTSHEKAVRRLEKWKEIEELLKK